MSRGWISLYRKTLDNPILKTSRKFSTFEGWIWLLLNVNHKERKVVMGTSIYKCKKGMMITSQKKLCKIFGWGNSRLRTFLLLLQKDEMIVVKTNQKLTQISLLNYDTYQDSKSLPTHKQITTKPLPNTNNNDNNVNNDNKDIREKKFNDNVKLIFDEKHKELGYKVMEDFCNYWTESNSGPNSKLRFEKQGTFAISRRLNTWINNSKDWNKEQKESDLNEYKLDTTGNARIGYCAACGSSDFYDKFKIMMEDSRCCNDKLVPKRVK